MQRGPGFLWTTSLVLTLILAVIGIGTTTASTSVVNSGALAAGSESSGVSMSQQVAGQQSLKVCPDESGESDQPKAASTRSVPKAIAGLSGAPKAPSLRLSPSSDTGVSNSDNLTGNNMPTFEGQAPKGTQILVYDGATLIGLADTDAQGKWAFAPDECSALSDGKHVITAESVDSANLASARSAELVVTIDTEPPAIPVITSPADQSHGRGGQVTIVGTASTNTTIKVMDGRAVQAQTRADGQGAWHVTLTGVPAGNRSYRASAVDAAGNESPAFNARSVTMDTTASTSLSGSSRVNMSTNSVASAAIVLAAPITP